MQTAPIAQSSARTDVPAPQGLQNAPLPLDLDALRHVVGGAGPGGSWTEPTSSWTETT